MRQEAQNLRNGRVLGGWMQHLIATKDAREKKHKHASMPQNTATRRYETHTAEQLPHEAYNSTGRCSKQVNHMDRVDTQEKKSRNIKARKAKD